MTSLLDIASFVRYLVTTQMPRLYKGTQICDVRGATTKSVIDQFRSIQDSSVQLDFWCLEISEKKSFKAHSHRLWGEHINIRTQILVYGRLFDDITARHS